MEPLTNSALGGAVGVDETVAVGHLDLGQALGVQHRVLLHDAVDRQDIGRQRIDFVIVQRVRAVTGMARRI